MLDVFADGVLLWSRMIALAAPDARPQVFRNCILEGAEFVRRGADRAQIIDELIERAERHELIDVLGGLEAVEQTITDILDAPTKAPAEVNGQDPEPPPWELEQTPPSLPALPIIDIRAWQDQPAPVRRWAVLNRIPAKNVTLLSGDGGLGKTLLTLQLAVATVLGRDCLGMLPTPGPVIIISAEENAEEMHARLDTIARSYGVDFNTLADSGLHLISLVGKDTALAIAGASGLVRPTPLFQAIKQFASVIKPVWIGLDTAADIFIVNERERVHARQCVNLLRGVAIEIDTAILLLSHPSQAGMREGHGQSGSTGWNNSVRSRLYLYRPEDEDGEPADPDVSVLEVMKSNYSARGEKIRLRWRNWMLTLEAGQIVGATAYDKASAERLAHSVFKRLLEFHNGKDIPVSATIGARNYAPTVFARSPEAQPLHNKSYGRRRVMVDTMNALLKSGEVAIGKGPRSLPPSKQSPCLYLGAVVGTAEHSPRLL